MTALHRDDVRGAAAVPAGRDGLGPRRALVVARARARLADRRRRRCCRSRHLAAPAAPATPARRRSPQARAFLADHPYLPVDESQRTLAVAPPMRVAVVAEFYPRRHDPGARRLGAPAGARRARRRGRRARCSCCTASCRRGAIPRRSRRSLRQPGADALDGLGGPLRALRLAAALARLRALGRVGGAGAAPRAARARGPFDLVHAHNAVPAGDAALRARRARAAGRLGPRRRRALDHRARCPAGATRSSACWARRASCSPTARASRRSRASTARARTRVVHLGTDVPAAPPRRARRR